MPLCNHCKNGIIDNEYEIQLRGQLTITDALLCGNDILKDLYYNRNAKTKSARVNSIDQPPILVGSAYGYCRGKFFGDCGHSILESEDDFEKSMHNNYEDS
jgi:hypothetical protein